MAAIRLYTHFRETPPVDGLCPKCSNPALKSYTLQRISIDGITPIGMRVACADCHVWIGPIKEFRQNGS